MTGHRDSRWVFRDLKNGVADTSVRFITAYGEHIKPVGKLEKCGRIYLRLLSRESNG